MLIHACKPSTLQTEGRRSQIGGQPKIYIKTLFQNIKKDILPQWLIIMGAKRKHKISANKHQMIFIMSYWIIILVPSSQFIACEYNGHFTVFNLWGNMSDTFMYQVMGRSKPSPLLWEISISESKLRDDVSRATEGIQEGGNQENLPVFSHLHLPLKHELN
jgi:hypothetical protein